MLRHDPGAGVPDESLHGEHEDVDVIDFAEERDVIRDDVERQHEIRERRADEQLVDGRDASVRQQSPQQTTVFRQLSHRVEDRALGAAPRAALRLSLGAARAPLEHLLGA